MTDTEMTIREYLPGDKGVVIKLWIECGLVTAQNNPELDIERKLQVNPELFMVGIVDDKIAVTVMGGYEGHRGWANYLAVHPDYQKRNYGRQIMDVLEKKLMEMGCPKINLNVRTTNMEAMKFYYRIGYSQDEVITLSKRFVKDEPF
ncbi:GNAT family acetyltransferase [Chloroflexota bacterium]